MNGACFTCKDSAKACDGNMTCGTCTRKGVPCIRPCNSCKANSLKCDSTLPSCQKCQNSGILCVRPVSSATLAMSRQSSDISPADLAGSLLGGEDQGVPGPQAWNFNFTTPQEPAPPPKVTRQSRKKRLFSVSNTSLTPSQAESSGRRRGSSVNGWSYGNQDTSRPLDDAGTPPPGFTQGTTASDDVSQLRLDSGRRLDVEDRSPSCETIEYNQNNDLAGVNRPAEPIWDNIDPALLMQQWMDTSLGEGAA